MKFRSRVPFGAEFLENCFFFELWSPRGGTTHAYGASSPRPPPLAFLTPLDWSLCPEAGECPRIGCGGWSHELPDM